MERKKLSSLFELSVQPIVPVPSKGDLIVTVNPVGAAGAVGIVVAVVVVVVVGLEVAVDVDVEFDVVVVVVIEDIP